MTSPKPRPSIIHGESHSYPVLPLRDIVVFPHMIVPLFVGREKSIRALEEVMKNDALIMLATQKNASDDDPTPESIYETGTLASVLQLLKLPDGTVKVLVEGLERARVQKYTDRSEYYEDAARIVPKRTDEGDPEGARRRRRPRRAGRSGREDRQDQAFQGSPREGPARAQEVAPNVADVRGSYSCAQLSRLAVVDPVEQEVQGQEGSGRGPGNSG